MASQPVPSALALQSYNLQIALVYVIAAGPVLKSFTVLHPLVNASHPLPAEFIIHFS